MKITSTAFSPSIKTILATSVLAIATTAMADQEEIRIHGGYAFLQSPAGVDSQQRYFVDLEFVQQGGIFGAVDLVADFAFSQTRVTIGDDEAVQNLLQPRVGPGVHFNVLPNVELYSNFKVVPAYEWLSVNGQSMNDDGADRYLFFRPELGLNGQEDGYVWRAMVFNDGSELASDRNGVAFAGHLHFDDPAKTINWGLRLSSSVNKTTVGVGFRL